jgi:hypothetical protein
MVIEDLEFVHQVQELYSSLHSSVMKISSALQACIVSMENQNGAKSGRSGLNLGIVFDFTKKEKVCITMDKYVEEMLKELEHITGTSISSTYLSIVIHTFSFLVKSNTIPRFNPDLPDLAPFWSSMNTMDACNALEIFITLSVGRNTAPVLDAQIEDPRSPYPDNTHATVLVL